MAILDAAVLGKCLDRYRGTENLNSALEEYQSIRLPITSKQVLSSRRLGRIEQGLSLPDREPFDPKKESRPSTEECASFCLASSYTRFHVWFHLNVQVI
ncbi:hypothetical protein Ddye_007601 [Dipteronia dyeriana]|uniref:FAD-binding domain-containing protein n=1 Tax=Dipteronia dyeriana TaxID=168575 RepID=A0AAD9XKQ6_9ROSI|nr:hypothetical protein Ddye_007601 [Dipteronia dyeriana]